MLGLTARELGTCVEVSVVGYPDVVRTELNIPPELTIICGVAVGYPDPDFPANKLRIGRDPSRRTSCSSIKLSLFAERAGDLALEVRGEVERK